MIQSRPQFGYVGALLVWLFAYVQFAGFNVFNTILGGEAMSRTEHPDRPREEAGHPPAGSRVGNGGCPWAPLWPGLIVTVERPRWHRGGDDPQWLPGVVAGAELESGAKGDGQAHPRCQFHSCRLVAFLLPPHESRSTDDVPDLLDGPVGHSSGGLARFELEVREAAKAADPAQRPDRGPIGCC
jgi:hypothetical protein